MAHFALSWDAHKSNICTGLSALQQNGEFVDMTIAADGHHVKVHQMIMSLVSPYIKELIASANCPHPVIFLNKVSYTTLCLILEYIYTGEVLVDNENLNALIEAGKELHIKGLEDMIVGLTPMLVQQNKGQPLSETGYFNKEENKKVNATPHSGNIPQSGKMERKSNTIAEVVVNDTSMDNLDDTDHHSFDMETDQDTNISLETQSDTNKVPEIPVSADEAAGGHSPQNYFRTIFEDQFLCEMSSNFGALAVRLLAGMFPAAASPRTIYWDQHRVCSTNSFHVREVRILGECPPAASPAPTDISENTQIQFTISNQGALQMILNRFIYSIRYTSRKMDGNSRRQWRCVNYSKGKCQARVFTRDEVVVKRFGAHNHPFHDQRILKKVRDNAVYTAIHDAERIGNKKKQERQARPTQKKKGDDTTDAE